MQHCSTCGDTIRKLADHTCSQKPCPLCGRNFVVVRFSQMLIEEDGRFHFHFELTGKPLRPQRVVTTL